MPPSYVRRSPLLRNLHWSIFCLGLWLAAASATAQIEVEDHTHDCSSGGAYVQAFTAEHRMVLCDNGVAMRHFPIVIGRNGAGKRVQGDGKTPLGVYPLGEARPSKIYGTFIPIGYPTLSQRAEGYTGADVGIHGPPRALAYAAAATMVLAFDWTQGCLALATDEATQEVAHWIASHHAYQLRVE